MKQAHALKAVNSLRHGTPPRGLVREFTVGRRSEIRNLVERLNQGISGALLLQANFGSGKSHLLYFVREVALEHGYVVSYVRLDATAKVRFNRMDQIMAEICSHLETPEHPDCLGLTGFLQDACDRLHATLPENYQRYSYGGYSYYTISGYEDDAVSSAVSQALRCSRVDAYQVQALEKPAYNSFYTDEYARCWSVLRDLHKLAIDASYRGLVILFDEFEDILTRLNRIDLQVKAFNNLFRFYGGRRFPGQTYYAVTPRFTENCKQLIRQRQWWASDLDEDINAFDNIPTFQMSPLADHELQELARRIALAHGIAFEWNPYEGTVLQDLTQTAVCAVGPAVPDRTRRTITHIVRYLDGVIEA